MNDVIQVRLGSQRASNWKKFLKRTGLNQADLVRAAVDERMNAASNALPSVAGKWAGKVSGRGVTATNATVARSLGR